MGLSKRGWRGWRTSGGPIPELYIGTSTPLDVWDMWEGEVEKDILMSEKLQGYVM